MFKNIVLQPKARLQVYSNCYYVPLMGLFPWSQPYNRPYDSRVSCESRRVVGQRVKMRKCENDESVM